jgi:glycosyltransferase involved in cell wall biosynthesis
LWRAFYLPKFAWRWRSLYPAYATVASYLSLLSWRFVRALRADRPDVFFVTDYATGRFDVLYLLARATGCRFIARHAGSTPQNYRGRLAKKWTIPHADQLIVSSSDERDMLSREYHVSAERLAVILTPVDVGRFRPLDRSTACREAGLDPSRKYLLFVGRFDAVKRIDAIIRAFAQVAGHRSNADLLLLGDGPLSKPLRELAKSCPQIHFLGWRSGIDEKVWLYNAAECLLLNSRREGFPRVVAEAMACGTPVLSSRVGGVGEMIVEDETGWMFPAGDDVTLTERMAYVLDHAEIVNAMRSQVRHIAETRVAPNMVISQIRKCFISEESA